MGGGGEQPGQRRPARSATRRQRLGATIMLTGLVSACSPVGVLNALAPREGVSVTRDLVYGPGPRRSLDLYAPTARPPSGADPSSGAPVVVFLYGGGWRSGDKAMYRFVAAALAARGYVTAVPDYRVYPEARFPDFLRDAAAAVAWTRCEAATFGGDPDRIVLMGHSAGAYLAAMLTLDPRWLGEWGLDPDTVLSGAIGLSGPYDFLPLRDPALQAIFAPAGDLRASQPISFARGDAPPLLLAHGRNDSRVWPANTVRLAEAVRARGGEAQERLYPGLGHATILGAVAAPLRWLAPVMADVDTFIAATPRGSSDARASCGPAGDDRSHRWAVVAEGSARASGGGAAEGSARASDGGAAEGSARASGGGAAEGSARAFAAHVAPSSIEPDGPGWRTP